MNRDFRAAVRRNFYMIAVIVILLLNLILSIADYLGGTG